jgi:hypothetical protein
MLPTVDNDLHSLQAKPVLEGPEKQRDVYLSRDTQELSRRAAALFKRDYFKIRFAVAA